MFRFRRNTRRFCRLSRTTTACKKTRELLTELNHPYVNWEYVLKELKSISIGDFYVYNNHPEGLAALSILLTIYFDILKSPASQDIN